jgi:hypothetical protein
MPFLFSGFFAALDLALQIRQNHGLQTIALLRTLEARASANICYASPYIQATEFCLISSEASCICLT